jgi:hypothetical protein
MEMIWTLSTKLFLQSMGCSRKITNLPSALETIGTGTPKTVIREPKPTTGNRTLGTSEARPGTGARRLETRPPLDSIRQPPPIGWPPVEIVRAQPATACRQQMIAKPQREID